MASGLFRNFINRILYFTLDSTSQIFFAFLNLLQADDEVEEAEGDQSIDMESGDEDQVTTRTFLDFLFPPGVNLCRNQ